MDRKIIKSLGIVYKVMAVVKRVMFVKMSVFELYRHKAIELPLKVEPDPTVFMEGPTVITQSWRRWKKFTPIYQNRAAQENA